ncbi:MAG: TetR/AcrR family transcriptional regulator [Solobacterium sp.]|nr:TetR/AcrR family transcriptional regulator [Solobacterium sp.]
MKDTKERIVNAFNTLAVKMPFHMITTDRICDQAGICRATFYRHFPDKYAVMNYNFNLLLTQAEQTGTIRDLRDLFEILLIDGSARLSPISGLFNNKGMNSLHEYIYEYSYECAKNLYETGSLQGKERPFRFLTEKEQLQLRLFCHGVSQFYEDWIRGYYSLSAHEAAEAMYELLPEAIKGDLFPAA